MKYIFPTLAILSLCCSACARHAENTGDDNTVTDIQYVETQGENKWPWTDKEMPQNPKELEELLVSESGTEYEPGADNKIAGALYAYMEEYPEKAIGHDFGMLNDSTSLSVHRSDDHRIMTVSYDTGMGGTSPDFQTFVLYDNGDSIVVDRFFPYADGNTLTRKDPDSAKDETFGDGTYVQSIITIDGPGGKSAYLVDCYFKASSSEGMRYITAMQFKDGYLRKVPIFNTPDEGLTDYLSIDYIIPDWYFRTDGHGWDWVMRYDKASKRLYLPKVDEDMCMTDRYDIYSPVNGIIQYQSTDGGCWLHESLRDFERFICMYHNDRRVIRIDAMTDGTYRYATWAKDVSFDHKPEIIIEGGRLSVDGKHFVFDNEGYTYILPSEQASGDSEPENILVIRHGGKEIQREVLE